MNSPYPERERGLALMAQWVAEDAAKRAQIIADRPPVAVIST